MKLFPWQQPSADKLVKIFESGGQVAIDASATGSGKTYIALDAARRLKAKPLVIAPRAARTAWMRVAADFGVTLTDVITPQRLLYSNPYYNNGEWKYEGLILWDEIHKGTSGENTKTTLALARTRVYQIPVLALSATIADSPLKMRGLGFLMGLHGFNKPSFRRWCMEHGCFPSPFVRGKLEFSKGQRGKDALARIHNAIANRMVRLRLCDIPDFPEGLVESKLFDLDEKYAKEVDEIYEQMEDRLKQPGANELVEVGRAREKVERCKVPLFVELVQDALEEGNSVVAFINYHSSRRALIEALAGAGIKPIAQIHGEQKPDEQVENMDRFQANTAKVCVVMVQAGGASINLHDVHGTNPRVSLITPSFSATDVLQCLGRIHRTGGTPVTQTFVLAAGTIEERIHRAIQRKLGAIQLLNDGDLL